MGHPNIQRESPFLAGKLLQTDLFSLARYNHIPLPHKDPSEEQWTGWHLVFTESDRWHYRDGCGFGEITPRMAVFGAPDRYYRCRHDVEIPSDSCLDIELKSTLFKDIGLEQKGFPHSVIRVTPRLIMLKETLKHLAASGCEDFEADETIGSLVIEICRLQKQSDCISLPPRARQRGMVLAAQEFMRRHFAKKLTLADLSASVGLSRFHFERVFKIHTGHSPYNHLRSRRLSNAAELLRETSHSITDIAYDSGFQDLSLFINSFRKQFGVSPSKFRAVKKSGK